MNDIENFIQKLKQKGYSLSIKDILTESFRIWIKLLFLGIFSILFTYSLISLGMLLCNNYWAVASTDANFILSIKNFYVENLNNKDADSMKKLWNIYYNYFSNCYVILRFIILLIIKIIISPLYAGILYCAYKYDNFGKASFKDLISGFEGKKFLNLLALNTVYLIISLCSLLFAYIPMIFLSPAFMLAGAFIIIHDVSFIKAIRYSTQIAYINFGKMLLLSIIIFVIGSVLGTVFMNFYAFIFTIPFSLVIIYVTYKRIIGYNFISNPFTNKDEKDY